MTKFNKEKVIDSIKNSAGIKSVILNRLGITRRILDIWLNKHPELKELYDEETERVLDKAESVIVSKVTEGQDISTVRWYLSTKGRARGYQDGSNIGVNVSTQGNTTISLNVPNEVLDIIKTESEKDQYGSNQ